MGDFQPTARVIADSITPYGHRLTTVEVSLHRFVLAEINTHRTFSRNSASSRAVPVRRMLAKVADTPAIPLIWPAEQKGMQGGEPLTADSAAYAREVWLGARDAAVCYAEKLYAAGVHKSVVNRLLEPFLPHTVIISATDWDGFWRQRCTPPTGNSLAQAEIVAAADAMKHAYDTSTPRQVVLGEWHLPYLHDWEQTSLPPVQARKISVARCARVSYLNQNGNRDITDDLNLYDRLVRARPPHVSPLEHVATPAAPDENTVGNFTGWLQLRHTLRSIA